MNGNSPNTRRRERRSSLIGCLLIVSIVGVVGCQQGALKRALILNEYTSPQELGPSFYDDAHYVGESPVHELRQQYDDGGGN